MKPLNEEKDVIITENRTLAEDNVNKEPEIIERKSRVSELSEQGKTLCESVQEKLAELSKSIMRKQQQHKHLKTPFQPLYRNKER